MKTYKEVREEIKNGIYSWDTGSKYLFDDLPDGDPRNSLLRSFYYLVPAGRYVYRKYILGYLI